MRSEHGLDRLLAFSDAVVAIALTLLVLPLVEIVSDTDDASSVAGLVRDHDDAFVGFAISFVVIWVLWRDHHALMEHFATYDRTLVSTHFVWLLTIVLLPFTTQLIAAREDLDGAVAAYVASLLVAVLALVATGLWGRRHPELLHDTDENRTWRESTPSGIVTVVLLVVVLALALAFPDQGAYPLLILLLQAPIERVRASRRRAAV
ncbi:TMEM175 family protein [Mumia qirimensis]|uniref:TMEM175 family protein n=1 Tax=Mumia qirimensis TaxID=3234852 RepID=UPI00351D94B1